MSFLQGHTISLSLYMNNNRCPNCRSTELVNYADGSLRCKYCGTIIGQTNMNSFGSMASRGVNNVGRNLSSGTKNKVVAILLAFLLGGFGGQYFYFGKIWQGILCILFSWTWIPTIWGIVQAIIFLGMSDDEFNYKYNQ